MTNSNDQNTNNQNTNNTDRVTPPKTLRQRIPTHLFGGRLRTTTAVLLIVFVGVLMLYGQRADHYKTIDDERAAAAAARSAAPRTTETTPEYTEPTQTRTSSSSSRSSSSTSPSDSVSVSVPSESAPTTTTTRPGFQLPTIPGIVLPGQTPTTTPVR